MRGTVLEVHEVADLFPAMTSEEFDRLVDDIADNGQHEPIWLHVDGRIIDGRHRAQACAQLGLVPKTRTWDGPDEKLAAFVVSLNLHRRHLNESQRAMVGARLATLGRGRPSENVQICTINRADAAELLNVSERSVSSGRKVLENGVPELAALVDSGNIAVSAAAAIAAEPPEVQQDIIAKRPHVANNAGDNEWYTPESYIKAARLVLGDIDLDPASSEVANENVGAAAYFTAEDDGLSRPWAGRVWMNPPYARPLIDRFCAKLAEEYAAQNVAAAVVLVNNATETGWFHALAEVASAICFPRGRVKFWAPGKVSTPLQGQAVIYLGPDVEAFRAEFLQFGFTTVL